MHPSHDLGLESAAERARLRAAWSANCAGSSTPHVVVALPSFNVAAEALAHYAARIPALEHRFLLALLMLPRIPGCRLVFVTCSAPEGLVLDYYLRLMPPDVRDSVRRRLHIVVVPDRTGRPVADKLLEWPTLLDEIHDLVGGLPGFVAAWNVTAAEAEVASRLGLPLDGTPPHVWPVGFKSSGRALFARAGVPVPPGRGDVRTADDVVAAVTALQASHPDSAGAVVKLDDSVAGDGNLVLPLNGRGRPVSPSRVRAWWRAVPDWYRTALAQGGIVEQFVTGDDVASPSAQADITPDGEVQMLSTHEQVLGGANAQVYLGCRFPANPDYAPELARHTEAVGRRLADAGAVGRFSVDFIVARDAAHRADRRVDPWAVHALEINLRRGGTTHPFTVLRNLVPGRYDAATATWRCEEGGTRVYHSTDNLQNDSWRSLTAQQVIDAVAEAGLEFDGDTRVGTVLHMLAGLTIDGRIGLTAIAHDHPGAEALLEATRTAIDSLRR